MTSKTLRVLKVDQPLGEFYIGAIESRELIEIATTDVRTFEDGNPASVDGIQRQLAPKRVRTLSTYVNLEYATFPTSIIISVSELCASLIPVKDCEGIFDLEISAFAGDEETPPISLQETAFIIDGQHRLVGLENLDKDKSFEVNVSIFVGADNTDKAEIFSRVNLAQTKVNKSLVYDLLDYARETSPYKVAHEIAVALNREPEGPLHNRIKRLGIKTPGIDDETLAQASVVNGLLRHLPPEQEKERSKGLFGLVGTKEPQENWRKRVFVDFYREEDTASMLENVSNYFHAVAHRWPNAWNDVEPGKILNRTTGYNGLIRFFQDAFLEIVDTPRVVSEQEFYELFRAIEIDEDQFTPSIFPPGGSGASKLYNRLKGGISRQKSLLG